MSKSKIKKSFLIFMLAASQLFALTGCRESEEIQNIILTADATEVDDTEELNPDVEGMLDELAPDLTTNSDTDADQEEEDSAFEQGQPSEVPVMETDYDSSSNMNATSQEAGNGGETETENGDGSNPGTDQGAAEVPSDQEGTEVERQPNNPEGAESNAEPQNEDNSPEDQPQDEAESSGNGYATLDEDPDSRQIYDENGQTFMPEKVRHVAAVGNAALIAQMLGGADTLVASSSDFLNNSLAQEVFADEGIGDVVQLWSNGSDSPMSDSEFETLLSLQPDCCIAISGQNTFSESQIKQLAENKIGYMTVPDCNTAYNIEAAVAFIGDAIGDNSDDGGLNSQSLAQEYLSYVVEIENDVIHKHGISSYENNNWYRGHSAGMTGMDRYSATEIGTYTAYISDWDDASYYRFSVNGQLFIDQKGIALTRFHASTPLPYYLSLAGVIDNATNSINETAYPFLLKKRDPEWTKYSNYATNGGLFLAIPTVVLNPYDNNNFIYYWMNDIRQERASYTVDASFSVTQCIYWDCFTANTENEDVVACLGDNSFPALIVASNRIKSQLAQSKENEYGLYRVGVQIPDEILGEGYYFWTYQNQDNNIDGARIHGDYDIFVNPKGVGSWTDGSVEAILESVWASYIYYNGFNETEVRDVVKSFYSKFYRHELTDSQLVNILEGP